jgi:hypothetical protein
MTVELIKKGYSYVGKDNKNHKGYDFYIVADGKRIGIKPTYNSSYAVLSFIAKETNENGK